MLPTRTCAPASPRSAKGCKARQAVTESNRLYAATPFSKSPAIVLLAEFRKTTSTPAKDRMTVERRRLTARGSCSEIVFGLGIGFAHHHRGEDAENRMGTSSVSVATLSALDQRSIGSRRLRGGARPLRRSESIGSSASPGHEIRERSLPPRSPNRRSGLIRR